MKTQKQIKKNFDSYMKAIQEAVNKPNKHELDHDCRTSSHGYCEVCDQINSEALRDETTTDKLITDAYLSEPYRSDI